MIYFPPLRTARLDVQLREMTIDEEITLAATPLDKHEAATAALLAAVVKEARGEHADPGRWTVQERMLVVAHYIAATAAEGGNFAVGEGSFLDYLDAKVDSAPAQVEAGEACGDRWMVRQVTGDEAQIIESMCTARKDWVAADMAARMRAVGSETDASAPDATDKPGDYGTWLDTRKSAMLALPTSDFADMWAVYLAGLRDLHHLFALDLDDAGYLAEPMTTEAGGQQLAPVRFSVAAAITDLARHLSSRPA